MDRKASYYADTPKGLVTEAGTRFATTERMLRSWAQPVLAEVPLEALLQQADVWLHSPRAVAAWTLLFLLFGVAPGWAALGAGACYLTWSILCPAYVSGMAARMLHWAENAAVQGLAYVAALSVMAAQERIAAVTVGLVAFVVLRWGVANLLLAPLVRRARSALFPLPAPDQVLRALIVRTALQRGLSLPEIDRMEHAIRDRHYGRGSEK